MSDFDLLSGLNKEATQQQVLTKLGGILTTNDSSEREFSPGFVSTLVTAAGDTLIYTPPSGRAWRLHWSYAVPVLRGSEDPPVITIKTITSGATKIYLIAAAASKRKQITMPVDAVLYVNLDIAGRVPTIFDIELL